MFNLLKLFIKKEKTPEPVIGIELASAYNQSRSGKGHNCFCHAPFANMLFSQSGNVHVCCHNLEYSIGKYPEQSLKEIWNSAKANELRDHMRNYDLAHGCGICEADLKMRAFTEVRARHFDHIPRHAKYPTQMEFLVSNQCNLECVMCKGEFSSLIRKNREKLPPLATPYDKQFLKQLEEFIPYLHETRFSGSGEAFSIDMNYEIWEMIIRINPKCIIMVQTNGTILTDRVKDMLNRGNFQIGVSLDSLQKATYESIRLNANFDKVMENIRFFSEYSQKRKMDFRIAMCIMRQNWRELPDFVRFGNSLKAITTFHKVWHPTEYALHNLTYAQLSEIHTHLSVCDFPMETPIQLLNRNHYRYIVSVIKNWMEAQYQVEEWQRNIDARVEKAKLLPYEELKIFIEKEFKNLTSNSAKMYEESDVLSAMEKLTLLLEMFQGAERERLLRSICAIPTEHTEQIFLALKDQSVEALFSQGKNWINEQAFEKMRSQMITEARDHASYLSSM